MADELTPRQVTKKRRAFGRSLVDFPNPNEAEREVIEATDKGRFANLGDKIPETPEERKKRTIRAGLVRFLALGGDDTTPVHEQGVQIRGALIDGALDLEGCSVVSDLYLERCDFTGTLTLRGARTQTISLSGSQLRDIQADRAEIRGSLLLRNNALARGPVSLLGVKIFGSMSCVGSRFAGQDKDGDALICDGLQAEGDVFLRHGFVAEGTVRLPGARIGGNLDCAGGTFESEQGDALHCDLMQVDGSAYLRGGFSARGAVRLVRARIVGSLSCKGGRFEARDDSEDSLICSGIRVDGDVFIDDGFVGNGNVDLTAATIIGDVVCTDATFGNSTIVNKMRRVLSVARATIGGTLWLSGEKSKYYGRVDLTSARISRIIDAVTAQTKSSAFDAPRIEAEENPAFLTLDGLSYDRFGTGTDLTAAARIAFLRLQTEGDLGENFKPQPWMQMGRFLRDSGHPEAAREVAIEYEHQRRKAGVIASKPGRALHWLYGLLVGYGHRPIRLFKITVSMWLIFGAIYFSAAELGVMAPTNPRVFDEPKHESCRPENGGNWTACIKAPYEYTTFNPWIYSLDLMLPFVDLQQDRDWAPMMTRPCAVTKSIWVTDICWQSAAVAKAKGEPVVSPKPAYWISGALVAAVMWFEILFGWAASLLLAAVLSGLAKRME